MLIVIFITYLQLVLDSLLYMVLGATRYGFISISKSIIEGKPIKVFNNGNMVRDFTYIDDIIESILD